MLGSMTEAVELKTLKCIIVDMNNSAGNQIYILFKKIFPKFFFSCRKSFMSSELRVLYFSALLSNSLNFRKI